MTTTQTTNLKDKIRSVRSQVGDGPTHPGSVNRPASAPLGGQAGTEKQER